MGSAESASERLLLTGVTSHEAMGYDKNVGDLKVTTQHYRRGRIEGEGKRRETSGEEEEIQGIV